MDKYKEWKHPWEGEFISMTKDFIFRNTFGDIEHALKDAG